MQAPDPLDPGPINYAAGTGVQVDVSALSTWAADMIHVVDAMSQHEGLDADARTFGGDSRLMAAAMLRDRNLEVLTQARAALGELQVMLKSMQRATHEIAERYRASDAYSAASVDQVRNQLDGVQPDKVG